MPPPLTMPLSTPGLGSAQAGAKGWTLARLIAAGLPVPDAFVVTAQAVAAESPGRASETLESAICTAYADFTGALPTVSAVVVAVRASLLEPAARGVPPSILNLRGPLNLVEAVSRCRQSMSSSGAVLVQRLVRAHTSGQIRPATLAEGGPNRLIAQASWGLGATRDGRGDAFVIDPASGIILASEIADKDQMTALLDQGVAEVPVADDLRLAPALDAAGAAELARLHARATRELGPGHALEWAAVNGDLYVLDAYPV